jgi:hypothetical protein
LPDGVKVARRFVKPLVLVRVQVWQPISLKQRISVCCHAILAMRQHFNRQRKKKYEIHYSFQKFPALSQELQTESCDSNPAGRETEPDVPIFTRWPCNQLL